jgi:hypothetical protein
MKLPASAAATGKRSKALQGDVPALSAHWASFPVKCRKLSVFRPDRGGVQRAQVMQGIE